MPLYEYQCDSCGHRFEVIQKFADAPIEACPRCGGRVNKLQSAPAFQFKGTGWYITDYSRKESAKDSAAGQTADSTKPAETKSDASAATPAPASPAKSDTP
jgi:putative FmdB family regulatory protein